MRATPHLLEMSVLSDCVIRAGIVSGLRGVSVVILNRIVRAREGYLTPLPSK